MQLLSLIHQVTVCNYGKGGNMKSYSVYEVGPPTSKCCNGLKSTNSRYPNLCRSR